MFKATCRTRTAVHMLTQLFVGSDLCNRLDAMKCGAVSVSWRHRSLSAWSAILLHSLGSSRTGINGIRKFCVVEKLRQFAFHDCRQGCRNWTAMGKYALLFTREPCIRMSILLVIF